MPEEEVAAAATVTGTDDDAVEPVKADDKDMKDINMDLDDGSEASEDFTSDSPMPLPLPPRPVAPLRRGA